MKTVKVLAVASISGVIAAGSIAAPAFAWHPEGMIKKSVQNQTANSQLVDANDTASAVSAKPGDILRYVIEVSNIGAADNSGHNDMYFAKLADTLPAGVQLVSDANKRQIAEELGILKPGQKVSREYLVKVTSTKDGDLIDNKACFTGDSEVKDRPQERCDTAKVKITNPPKPEEPKPKPEAPKPETPAPQTPAPVTPAELPHTGASSVIAPLAAVGAGSLGYVSRLLVVKRRQK
jgi:uncharacterized repeat protein (TIGR01451 family)